MVLETTFSFETFSISSINSLHIDETTVEKWLTASKFGMKDANKQTNIGETFDWHQCILDKKEKSTYHRAFWSVSLGGAWAVAWSSDRSPTGGKSWEGEVRWFWCVVSLCVPGWRQGRGPSWRWDPAHQGLPFHTWQKQVMLFQGSFFRQITWTLQGHGRTPSCPSGTPAPRAPPLKRFHRYLLQLKEMFNVSEILPIKTNNSFDNVSNSNDEVLSTNEFPLSKLDIVITQHQPQNHHYPHHCHWYCHHCDCHCHCHR